MLKFLIILYINLNERIKNIIEVIKPTKSATVGITNSGSPFKLNRFEGKIHSIISNVILKIQ